MMAFEGVRVLDFTHVLAGPFCTYQLAVMGADVVKIEPPHDPDMMRTQGYSEAMNAERLGSHFVCQNGNKRAVSIDITSNEGADLIRELIKTADVLVENYRGGVMERHGLDYAKAAAINPKLIYCSMTGFGHTGPKSQHPAYDNVIQAFSGLMAATGSPENHPVRVGPAVLDYGTGSQAAFAVATALFQRTRTGKGQHIDVAMADAALMLMTTHVMDAQVLGKSAIPFGNRNPARVGYSLYDTRDGLLMIGAFTAKQNQRLWRILGRDDLADAVGGYSSAQFAESAAEHKQIIERIVIEHDAAYWETRLMDGGVPAAKVRRVDEAIAHPQIQSRGVVQEIEADPETGRKLFSPVAAFGYAHDGPALRSPAPGFAQHTREVLLEAGLAPQTVDDLASRGIVQCAPNQQS